MSWFLSTSGRSNADLINNLLRHHIIKTPFIKEAMLKVDRKNFLRLPKTFNEAYSDVPLPLNDSVTISAPHMHATALEYLVEQLGKFNCKCLDVGSGAGYLVSCMLNAMLMKNGNQIEDQVRVVGIEYLDEIAEFSKQALKNDLERLYGPGIYSMYTIITGDGWKGVPQYAPYDAIHVGAAAESIPQKLVDQLANGGRMVIPVGKEYGIQYIYLIDKDNNGSVSIKKTTAVRFVPLINKSHESGLSVRKTKRL